LSSKFAFRLLSEDSRRPLPSKIIIGEHETETAVHVVLKALAYLFFYRDRIQVETDLHLDSVPFVPDLAQLDYTMRPALWVECGECSVAKLNKLATKLPEAEIWVVRPSRADGDQLLLAMKRAELRQGRYHVLALETEGFNEILGLLQPRNEVRWYRLQMDPPVMQFDFNGLWFELPFDILEW